MICHYWFFNQGFKFQDSVRTVAIGTVKNVDYRCISHNISKSKAINLSKIMCLKIVGIYETYCQTFDLKRVSEELMTAVWHP